MVTNAEERIRGKGFFEEFLFFVNSKNKTMITSIPVLFEPALYY